MKRKKIPYFHQAPEGYFEKLEGEIWNKVLKNNIPIPSKKNHQNLWVQPLKIAASLLWLGLLLGGLSYLSRQGMKNTTISAVKSEPYLKQEDRKILEEIISEEEVGVVLNELKNEIVENQQIEEIQEKEIALELEEAGLLCVEEGVDYLEPFSMIE